MKYKLYNNFKIIFETPDDGYSYFFGYYDKSPLSKNSKYLLSHRVNFDGREINENDYAEIGYWDIEDSIFVKIDKTKAFNWQQGANLQWLPPEYNKKIIYNNKKDGKFISIIYDIEKNKKNIINYPIYSIHPSGRYALAVNYERLYFCRPGYNYCGIINEKWNNPYNKEDGIFKVDLETGKTKQIISTKEIVENQTKKEMIDNYNWLEHIMINPSGERFMFLHRWLSNDFTYTRLYTSSIDGKDLFMYPDVGFYSHYSWKNENELSIWTYRPGSKRKINNKTNKNYLCSSIKSLIRPTYKRITSFIPYEFRLKYIGRSNFINFKDRTSKYEIIGEKKLFGNGHTTWSRKKMELLNDTYQNENNYRYLYIYNLVTGKFKKLFKAYSMYNDCVYRCDLHPRYSFDEKKIIIDSAHKFNRKQIILEGDYNSDKN